MCKQTIKTDFKKKSTIKKYCYDCYQSFRNESNLGIK